jgi:hypothetical protein
MTRFWGRKWRIFGDEHSIVLQIQYLTRFSPFLTDSCVRHYGPRAFERLKFLISREQYGQAAEHLSNACS